jgi:2-polyprenyl-3-methyl-5-hydroxy-6-metoxy-1,4-benzoquinol methylase
MAFVRSCPVCSRQNTKVLFSPIDSPGPVSKCMDCGMVYVSSIVDDHALIIDGPVIYGQMDASVLTSSNWDDIKGSWEFKHLPDKESEWQALKHNAIDAMKRVELYSNNSFAERRILDFGSGWGIFLSVAKERGWKAYGLEPLPASAVYARATFGLNITTDTLREDTFPPNFFDAITSFQVFEHLPNVRSDIQNLFIILRQNGIILIEVPNIDTWTVKIMKSRHRHFVPDHLNFFSINTLSQLLVCTGFKVIDHFHTTRRMSICHLIQHWFPRFLPSPINHAIQSVLQKTSLWEYTISLNIGDIITVIAQKPQS